MARTRAARAAHTASVPTRSSALAWLAAATPAVAVLLFVPGLPEGFEFPKAAFVRFAGAVALLLLWRIREPIRLRRFDVAVLAWLTVEALATAFGSAPWLSLTGEVEQHEGLLTSVGLAALYAAARRATRAPRDLERIQSAFLAAAALSAGYALVQAALLDPLAWGRLSRSGDFVRPFGSAGHANLLGVVVAAGAGLAAVRLVRDAARRWLYAPLALLLLVTALLTVSRGAWAGAAVAVVVGVIGGLRAQRVARQARGPERQDAARVTNEAAPSPRLAKAPLAAVTIALAALVWLVTGPFGGLLAARSSALLAGSGGSRLEIWRGAWSAFIARPLLGHGPDAFRLVFPAFQSPEYWRTEWAGVPVHAHDVALHTLATRGALGLLVAIVLVVLLAAALSRQIVRDAESSAVTWGTLAALAGVAVCGVFGALGVAMTALVAVLLGAHAGLEASDTHGRARPVPAAVRLLAPALALVLVAGAGLVLAAGRERRIASGYAASEVAAHTDDQRRALRRAATTAAMQALRWTPWDDEAQRFAAEQHTREALLSRAPASMLAEAERHLHAAVALTPRRALHWQRLAGLAALGVRLGTPGAAAMWDSCFARARVLAPQDALLVIERAQSAMRLGDMARARSAADLVVAMTPYAGPAWVLVADVARADGRDDEAREALDRAAGALWSEPAVGRRHLAARRSAWGMPGAVP